ncbi:MAG: hypothetical protein LQ343_005174 [Gyalolechia ehrenbergii]|nr:MAG: hypothetical protein LQ343_005174 [Gyalolechia ehrenbergii]
MDHSAAETSPPSSRTPKGWQNQDISPTAQAKIKRVLDACTPGSDIEGLIQAATSSDGLMNDEVRRKAWPILLGYTPPMGTDRIAWQDLPPHKDEHQVRLDVDRSFIYYPRNESEAQLERRKSELSAVITQVLRTYPMLSYFQGFHDIVQVFLLVLGVDDAAAAVSHLSLLRIRDFMLPSLSPSLAHLRLLPSILQVADTKLCKHLSETQPFFALGAVLTLYAHEIQEYGDIARLFDFLLAHGAVVSVYFFAVIILSRREELFEIPADEPEMLHSILSKLPKPLDLEALIAQTMSLYVEFPPERLPFRSWARISPFSVLKTTRGDFRQQSLNNGVDLFEKQASQLRREQWLEQAKATVWKYRRPAGRVGLAIFVGMIAFWLRRSGFESYGAITLRRLWEHLRFIGRR